MIDIDSILFWVAIVITIADLTAIGIGIYKWSTDKNNKKKWGMLTIGAFIVALVLGIVIGLQLRPQDSRVVDDFEYENHEVLENTWHRLGSEGSVTNLQLENDSAPGVPGTQSMRVTTNVPCLQNPGRFQRIERILPDSEQDWSDSNLLEVWVKGDDVAFPSQCQLSVFLIETNGEIWQSTQYFNRLNDWTKITINLVGSGIDHPANHPNDVVVPTWATDEADIHRGHGGEESVRLDLDQIGRIGIEVIAENEWACDPSEEEPEQVFPDCSVMLDHIVRR